MINLLHWECLSQMKLMSDNSVDSIVTDAPYGLKFMWKKWDHQVPSVEIWKEALRVLKPWWHLLSFAGSRTYHRMAVNIEDAGFEIRDQIMRVYWCLSEDTEILTKSGFIHYSKITWNNPVFCYNVDTNEFEYHLSTKTYLYDNEHTAYRIQSDTTDQIVSRNHRVAVEQDGRIIFKQAETLEQQENIPFLESVPEMQNSIHSTNQRASNEKQELRWMQIQINKRIQEVSTEGNKTYDWGELWDMLNTIYDKEEQALKVLLLQMQWDSEMTKPCEVQPFMKSVTNRRKQKEFQWKDGMSKLQVLEMMRNYYKKEMKVCESENKICEMSDWIHWDEQEGLICNATQTECCKRDMKTTNKNWVCASHKSQCWGQQDWKSNVVCDKLTTQELWTLKRYNTTLATITPIEYQGKFWCVEVPTGCFLARRNGKIFITGNSGFPKSLNIWKKIDQMQGNKRVFIWIDKVAKAKANKKPSWEFNSKYRNSDAANDNWATVTKGSSPSEWRGTQLKPAHEPIVLARKPLSEKTIAKNVLEWGTGGINIDGSRVGIETTKTQQVKTDKNMHHNYQGGAKSNGIVTEHQGRFPANFIHDGSDEVVGLFPESKWWAHPKKHWSSVFTSPEVKEKRVELDDSGSAARFFKTCPYETGESASFLYQSKASKKDRDDGLDWHKRISIMGIVLSSNDYIWLTEKPDKKVLHLLDIELYQTKEDWEFEINIKKGQDLSMYLYEKLTTDRSLNECKSIIKTMIDWTISSVILKWLHLCITKEYTPDVNWEIEFGENLVANVEWCKILKTIIRGKIEFLHDVKNVVSKMQLITKERENKNKHNTVKPTALMQYLVRLVTPAWGTVLDPFMGSWSTGKACVLEGFDFIGIEMDEGYVNIAQARINHTKSK